MTKIIAHRGYSAKVLEENTLAAFKAALDNNADAIELDVHLTVDGRLIVHHDYYLGSPDNDKGLIFKSDLAHIQNLRIGHDMEIPTLDQVFARIGRQLQYEIELKGFTDVFLQKVVELVERHNLAQYIEFTSPHPYNLTRLKKFAPHYKTGVFVSSLPDWMDKELGQILAINNGLLGDAAVLHCPLDLIDAGFIRMAKACSLELHASDCNTEEELNKAFSLGVDQLSTDRLELALKLRDKIT